MTTSKITARPTPSAWPFIWLGVVAHLIWGSYPVLAKVALTGVPKFSLVLLASLGITLAGFAIMRWLEEWPMGRALRVLASERALWLLALFVAVRAITNIIAIDLTRSVWVQLIYTLTPFFVAILGALFFGQSVPRYTFTALFFATLGGVLLLVEDWSSMFAGFSHRDVLGIVVALISTLALATYFQLVRRCRLSRATDGLILFQQGMAMTVGFVIMTLLAGEDWSAWGNASTESLLAALAVIGLVQVGGNLIQVKAVGGTNPALVTSTMPLRLVSTLALAALLLGEHLTAPTQWAGAAIVVVSVSAYLWVQR